MLSSQLMDTEIMSHYDDRATSHSIFFNMNQTTDDCVQLATLCEKADQLCMCFRGTDLAVQVRESRETQSLTTRRL